MEYPYFLRHVRGCGKPAFYLSYKPVYGEKGRPDGILPNGEPLVNGMKVFCGECGDNLSQDDLLPEYFEEIKDACN
jgi:hypothetical protein